MSDFPFGTPGGGGVSGSGATPATTSRRAERLRSVLAKALTESEAALAPSAHAAYKPLERKHPAVHESALREAAAVFSAVRAEADESLAAMARELGPKLSDLEALLEAGRTGGSSSAGGEFDVDPLPEGMSVADWMQTQRVAALEAHRAELARTLDDLEADNERKNDAFQAALKRLDEHALFRDDAVQAILGEGAAAAAGAAGPDADAAAAR